MLFNGCLRIIINCWFILVLFGIQKTVNAENTQKAQFGLLHWFDTFKSAALVNNGTINEHNGAHIGYNANHYYHHKRCPNNFTGQLPYANDCKYFLNCWKGNGYVQSCSPGTMFNTNELKCDYEWKVNCKTSRDYESIEHVGHNQVQNDHNYGFAEKVNATICQPNLSGYKPHPTNCTQFINCTNGYMQILRCGPGMAYIPSAKLCDYKYKVDCSDRERTVNAVDTSKIYNSFWLNRTESEHSQYPLIVNRNAVEWKNKNALQNKINITNLQNITHISMPPSRRQHQKSLFQLNDKTPTNFHINSIEHTTVVNIIEKPLYLSPLAPFKNDGNLLMTEATIKYNNKYSTELSREPAIEISRSFPPSDKKLQATDSRKVNVLQFTNYYDTELVNTEKMYSTPLAPIQNKFHAINSHTSSENSRISSTSMRDSSIYHKNDKDNRNMNISSSYDSSKLRTIEQIVEPLNLAGASKVFSTTEPFPQPFSTTMNAPVTTVNKVAVVDTQGLHLNEALRILLRPYANKETVSKNLAGSQSAYLTQLVQGIKNHSSINKPSNYSTDTYITSMKINEFNTTKQQRTDEIFTTNLKHIVHSKEIVEDIHGSISNNKNSNISNGTFNSEKINRKQLREIPEGETHEPFQQNVHKLSKHLDLNDIFETEKDQLQNNNSDGNGEKFDQILATQNFTTTVTYVNLPKVFPYSSNQRIPSNLDYEMQLTDGIRPKEGRIRLKIRDRWGYLCSGVLDKRAADVACRELGYPMANKILETSIPNDMRSSTTFTALSKLHCNGNETKLRDCNITDWIEHSCANNKIIEILCNEQLKCPPNFWLCEKSNQCIPLAFVCDTIPDCADKSDESSYICNAPKSYRLTGGQNEAEGRLEVLYHGEWGTICDDDFGTKEARVACKSLGFIVNEPEVGNTYGTKKDGPIWLNQVSCRGDEQTIDQCKHKKWGQHSCDHSEDVGIKCLETTYKRPVYEFDNNGITLSFK